MTLRSDTGHSYVAPVSPIAPSLLDGRDPRAVSFIPVLVAASLRGALERAVAFAVRLAAFV